eukprot:TRINITY_DN5828_c0_g1_i2.p1 TRINITY_DN5828_c0_g1~~TRINITY_DN5828_c0_g1_i2.p1  ORF type:complete len:435 (+),score=122.08 TRINITY_DN5828_c0_g1_i2:73-1377(+)
MGDEAGEQVSERGGRERYNTDDDVVDMNRSPEREREREREGREREKEGKRYSEDSNGGDYKRRRTGVCFRCGGEGHIAVQCPNKAPRDAKDSCYGCGGRGHIKARCPSASAPASSANLICHRCGGKGHIASFCDDRARDDRYRDRDHDRYRSGSSYGHDRPYSPTPSYGSGGSSYGGTSSSSFIPPNLNDPNAALAMMKLVSMLMPQGLNLPPNPANVTSTSPSPSSTSTTAAVGGATPNTIIPPANMSTLQPILNMLGATGSSVGSAWDPRLSGSSNSYGNYPSYGRDGYSGSSSGGRTSYQSRDDDRYDRGGRGYSSSSSSSRYPDYRSSSSSSSSYDRDRRGGPRYHSRDDSRSDKCFTCGQEGHRARDCHQKSECFRCGGFGHFARECTQPRQRDSGSSRSSRDDTNDSGSRERDRDAAEYGANIKEETK